MNHRLIRSAVVTGPTGSVGTALCQRLLQEGIEVYAVVRPGSPRVSQLPEDRHLHVVACGADRLKALSGELTGVHADVFYHLAWAHTAGPGRNDMPSQVQNIQNTLDAVHAAHEMGCKVFIGAGSQAEYGRVEGLLRADTPAFPENGYGMAKLCAGQMSRVECAALGMDHVWVRILSVYGPRDGMGSMISSTIQKLLLGECPALTAGGQRWDYLYSADAAEALYLCAVKGKNGAVYPLGSGKARPLREYVEIMRDAIDPSLKLGFGEIPYAPLQVMHLQADITDLEQDTGFRPSVAFETGIRDTIEWMRCRLHA